MINFSEQHLDQDDYKSVMAALQGELLTQGHHLTKFEEAIAATCQSANAIVVSSATAALHLTCLALGINQTSKVWVPAISFVASANCALYCGATVDYLDIDRNSFNLCMDSLKNKLSKAEQVGNLPDYIVAVHMAGTPCDMLTLESICAAYEIKVIEDASHAFGAQIANTPIGSPEWPCVVASIFSFHPVKMITTGEGGAVVTDDQALAERIRSLRSHGITRSQTNFLWEYDQVELGFNYRLPELNCALGQSQIEKLKKFVIYRNELAARYDSLLENSDVMTQRVAHNTTSSRHLYLITSGIINTLEKKNNLMLKLLSDGIRTQVHYIPIYKHRYHAQLLKETPQTPNAENYYTQCLTLPLHVNLSAEQVDFIAKQVLIRLGEI